jgi:hypothetical protein
MWSEIADVLRGMGVPDLEIEAYRFLAENGPSTPSVIARETRQSRGRIYRVLRGLAERSLAREDATRPIRYSAVPLSDVLLVMVAQAKRRAEVLQEALVSEERRLESRLGQPPAPVRSRAGDVSVLSGRVAIFAEARRYAVQAGQFLLIAGNGQTCRRLAKSYALLGELRAAIARRVDVQIRLQELPEMERQFQFLAEELGPDRVTILPNLVPEPFMLVATERGSMLVLVQPDDPSIKAGGDIGVRVSSPVAGALARSLFSGMDHLHKDAKSKRLQAGVAEGALMSARHRVRAMGRLATGVLAAEGSSSGSRRAELLARGIDVRIVEADNPRVPEAASDRILPRSEILIVDDTVVLQWFPTADDPRPVAPARASTDVREVQFWTQFFDYVEEASKARAPTTAKLEDREPPLKARIAHHPDGRDGGERI